VFLVNSRHPLVCATGPWLPKGRSPLSRSYGGKLPSSFNTVRSRAWVCSTSPPVSVWGTVLVLGLFPGPPWLPGQSVKPGQRREAVTTSGLRNFDLIPIGYGFRPRLRGRLTLRGRTLRRNPWTSGDRDSHPVERYSCQHVHFRYLQPASRPTFTGLRNAPLPGQRTENRDQRSDPMLKDLSRPCSILAIS
jgi:hypothetical protein